jgi:hypothetical protein
MAVPSTVTKRSEGNTFIAVTGMTLTGVTGFGLRTGFYLTNSGSYPIETEVSYNDAQTPGIFTFPSGQDFNILPGQNKFIPFEMVFAQNNTSGPTDTSQSTGPDTDGVYRTIFTLNTRSEFDGQSDPDGVVEVYVTGYVSGFLATPGTTSADITAPRSAAMMSNPVYPSGFLVETSYANNGKPRSVLRWQHPSTGYYLKRYQIDYAGNIEDSSATTGSWTGLTTFDINYESTTYTGPNLNNNLIDYKKYATNTGIAQMYTRGTNPNPPSEYGEHTVSDLGFGANYYYRIKSEYLDRDSEIAYESPYVYGYPVDNFNVEVTNSDVNEGLLSGSSTLPVAGNPSVISNVTSDPQSLDIYFEKGQKDINLKTAFDKEISDRGVSVNIFDPTHADYSFSGVHFTVPKNAIVGSETVGVAGITSGGQIKYGSTEIKTVLNLEKNSLVAGMGGKGGDGGYTDIEQDVSKTAYLKSNKFNIIKSASVESVNGGDGTAAIYINDTSIALLQIKKDPTSRIYGGGGGGGGGDPFFFPKGFASDIAGVKKDVKGIREGKKKAHTKIALSDAQGATIVVKKYASEEVLTSYTFSDVIGTQLGGVGGGGQGFGLSSGGASLKTKTGTVIATFKDGQGGINGAGYGSTANSANKISPAGNGGVFGQDGDDAFNLDASIIFRGVSDATPREGGSGGESVKVITGNNNYSTLQSLVQPKGALEPTVSNFPSLLAWFTTDDTSKLTATFDGSYKYISNWQAKNDSSINIVFPRTGWTSLYNRPVLIEEGVTLNSGAYTKAFNNKDVVHFGLDAATAGEITGLVKSGKLEMDMPGFEIVYFLYPSTLRATNAAGDPIYAYGDKQRGAFRLFEQNSIYRPRSKAFNVNGSSYRNKNGKMGWGLHQWTVGPSSLFYYTKDNQNWSAENAGLLDNKQVNFRDFTNGVSPERAWMYSISAFRRGSVLDYRIYNDLDLIYKEDLLVNKFKWMGKPLIGANSGFSNEPAKNYTTFFGGISDILVFKKGLSATERAAIYGYITDTKLRIPTVRNYTVTAYSALYKASLSERSIYFTSLPEYIFAGRKVVFSNGAIFTFTKDQVKYATTVKAEGTLTADINGESGTLYPAEEDRNTVALQNGYAGFNLGPQW